MTLGGTGGLATSRRAVLTTAGFATATMEGLTSIGNNCEEK
jgi:hypothetical protein